MALMPIKNDTKQRSRLKRYTSFLTMILEKS